MPGLGKLKIFFKIGLIVMSLALQMAGQIWFASLRMESIDASYSDVVRRVDKFTIGNARASRYAEAYASNAIQLATEVDDKAQYSALVAESRAGYENLMGEVLKALPEKTLVIDPVVAGFRKAFVACDPAIQAAAKASSSDDGQKAVSRLKQECIPQIRSAMAAQSQLTDGFAADAARAADQLSDHTKSTVITTYVTVAIGLILNLIFASWVGISGLSRPIQRLKTVMQAIANNDLSAEVPGKDDLDEIGDMARTVEVFKTNALEVERLKQQQAEQAQRVAAQRRADMQRLADDFEASVGDVIHTVASAAGELESSARSLTSTAEREEHLAATVASASEQASANVQSVASATEEMSASVAEIGRQVRESTGIAHQAVDQANRTNNRIGELAAAATRIGNVVELINTIAGQTNLLALNATIEAARAGDAGRGFAVVASEVKILAEQTAKATNEISEQITGIQLATRDSVAAIKEIGDTIGMMAEISSSIVSAVEEQGAATQEIARNVQEASIGTTEVSNSIVDVQQGANETGEGSAKVLAAAQSLLSDSSRLRNEVGNFLKTVRAA